MIYILLGGLAGGITRGLVGFVKHHFAYKNVKFELYYFLAMVAITGVVGLSVSWAVSQSGLDILGSISMNPGIAFLVGYAGGDFVENVYKILTKKGSLYGLPMKESKSAV